MKMLRRLPKILRFIPGTAQDVRAYFLTLQYWLAGSDDNIANMVRFLVDRYADGPRRACAALVKVARRRSSTPRSASTTRACAGRLIDRRRATCRARPPAASGTVGPAAAALLPAGRQRRPLRRRDRRARGARPARDPGLRHRPRRAPGDRALLHAGRPRRPSTPGVADRLLAGRRPGLQRRQGRRGRCWPRSTCPTSPRIRWSSRRWSSGAAPSAACCRWKRP